MKSPGKDKKKISSVLSYWIYLSFVLDDDMADRAEVVMP